MISEVAIEEGILCLSFAQEFPVKVDRITSYDRLRMELNLHLQPNLWTPFSPEVERRIGDAYPFLRHELLEVVV